MKLLVENENKITAIGESSFVSPNPRIYNGTIEVSWKKWKIIDGLNVKNYLYLGARETTTYAKTQLAFNLIARTCFPDQSYKIVADFKPKQ